LRPSSRRFSLKIKEKYLQFQTIATISVDDQFNAAPADGKSANPLSLMISVDTQAMSLISPEKET
jgi:hypothetical protein